MNILQILMSVQRGHTCVLKIAGTLLGPILAVVVMVSP